MIAGCSGDMLVDDFVELVAMRVRVFLLLAFTWWVRAAKLCAWGRLFLTLVWLDTLLSLWWVVYEEALHVRDLRQFLAPGIVTCATWEGAGQRGTRVFGVLRRGVLCLSRNPALSLRVKISFRGDLHSQVEVVTRRSESLLHRPSRYLPQVADLLLR